MELNFLNGPKLEWPLTAMGVHLPKSGLNRFEEP